MFKLCSFCKYNPFYLFMYFSILKKLDIESAEGTLVGFVVRVKGLPGSLWKVSFVKSLRRVKRFIVMCD